MRYFRHDASQAKAVTLYPFSCWHRGAEQSDEKFINEMIYRVKHDPTGRWIYMGDGGEVVTKSSKGDVFAQTMSPQEQLNDLVRLLKPIRDKGLFAIRGNHGHRTYKDTGLEFDESLALALGLPYLGISAFWQLRVNRSQYDIYTHHGADSGATLSSKVNAAKKPEAFIHADAIFTGHSHIAMELPPKLAAYLDTATHAKNPIRWTETRSYIVGSAYDSRIDSYGEEKLYSPIIPSHIAVTFSGNQDREKSQSVTIYRAK